MVSVMNKLVKSSSLSYVVMLLISGGITYYSSIGIFVLVMSLLAVRLSPERSLYSIYEQLTKGTIILCILLSLASILLCDELLCMFIDAFGTFIIFSAFFSLRSKVNSLIKTP